MSAMEHVNRSDCWCGPKLMVQCPICLAASEGCPACEKGFVDVSREEFDASELSGVAIHRDVKEAGK